MPLYEYACRTCGTAFELRMKFEERLRQQTCPRCGGTDTALRLSAPALVGAGGKQAAPVCSTSGNPCNCGMN
ncbi:MAG: zinc ribbon domain-containing protein [Gemmatimonadetes bacterium]|nr:zinc ribbon domain-containing protein [Gemmatimonadota bacterium]